MEVESGSALKPRIGQVIGHVSVGVKDEWPPKAVDPTDPKAFRGLVLLVAAQCGLPVPPPAGVRGHLVDGVRVSDYSFGDAATFRWARWCVSEAGGGPALLRLVLTRHVGGVSAQICDKGRSRSLRLGYTGLPPTDVKTVRAQFEAALAAGART